jgi:hypothetical protein
MTTIEPAVEEFDPLMQFEKLREVLTWSHNQIPALLQRRRELESELGMRESAELRKQFADVESERQSAVRRRAAAIDGIVQLEEPLRAERALIEADREARAAEAVEKFMERFNDGVAALQRLWQEGEALGRILRVTIPMALPAKVVVSPVDAVARIEVVRSTDALPTAVDAQAAKLGARLDELDAGLARIAAVKQSRETDARHFQLSRLRRTQGEFHETFVVVREGVMCLADGLAFPVGSLLDHTLVGHGGLGRLLQSGHRLLQPVALATGAAA